MIRVQDSAGSTLVEWGRQQQQQHDDDDNDADTTVLNLAISSKPRVADLPQLCDLYVIRLTQKEDLWD